MKLSSEKIKLIIEFLSRFGDESEELSTDQDQEALQENLNWKYLSNKYSVHRSTFYNYPKIIEAVKVAKIRISNLKGEKNILSNLKRKINKLEEEKNQLYQLIITVRHNCLMKGLDADELFEDMKINHK